MSTVWSGAELFQKMQTATEICEGGVVSGQHLTSDLTKPTAAYQVPSLLIVLKCEQAAQGHTARA